MSRQSSRGAADSVMEPVVEADDREQHIGRLKLAEHQFRLACTVNLAVTNRVQSLDVPVEWTFGRHRVRYLEFGLRQDQADVASCQSEMTATCVLAGVICDAVLGTFKSPKRHDNGDVVSAYQISRMIRNAFSHSMVSPRWSIDQDCKNREFTIDGVISLDTAKLHEKLLDWRDYGVRLPFPISEGSFASGCWMLRSIRNV
jgi:hypothetical protein